MSQAVAELVDVLELLMVRVNVWVESQPAALVYTLVYTPDVVYVTPSQV